MQTWPRVVKAKRRLSVGGKKVFGKGRVSGNCSEEGMVALIFGLREER